MHAALVSLLLTAGAGQHLSFETGPNPDVRVSQIAGPLTVQRASGATSEVDAVWTGGSEAEHAKWHLDTVGKMGTLDVRVCCGPCDAHENHDCTGEGDLAITLRVPAQSKLELHEVSGAIDVTGVTGEISVNTVSGSVALRGTQGALRLHAVSGKIDVQADKAAPVKLNTVSGSATITLPKNAGANLRLSTVSGSLNGKRAGIGNSSQKIGGGGPEIDATTVSGNVDVR